MYEIKSTGERFYSFLDATRTAAAIRADVFEVETGARRWTPAPQVSKKRMRQYHEQAAAYAAQQSQKRK